MRPLIRRMRRDRRGTTATEFAILCPILMLLICGGIEFGHFYMAWMTLEGATLEAARTVAVTQEKAVSERDTIMRTKIQSMMAFYPLEQGKSMDIQVKSYEDFSAAGTPEPYVDMNGNGAYDGPGTTDPLFPGEPFTDKNGNGIWDPTTFKSQTVGSIGEVVSYTVTYPAAYYFSFLAGTGVKGITLQTIATTRNEPVKSS